MQYGWRSTFIECQESSSTQHARSRSVPAGGVTGDIDFFLPEREYVNGLMGRTEALRDNVAAGVIVSASAKTYSNEPKERTLTVSTMCTLPSDTSTCERVSCASSARADSFSSGNCSSDEATPSPTRWRAVKGKRDTQKCASPHTESPSIVSQRRHRLPQNAEWYDEDFLNGEAETCLPSSSPALTTWHDEKVTTIMICNIPCSTKELELENTLESMGLRDRYDFLNLPSHHKAQSNLGYAFINFLTPGDAALCTEKFADFRFPNTRSTKVCTVKPARVQGYEANAQQSGRAKKVGKATPSNSLRW